MVDPRDWLNERLAEAYILASGKATHTNTCSTSVAPARQPGPCDCEAEDDAAMGMEHWGRARAMASKSVVGSPLSGDQRATGAGPEDGKGRSEEPQEANEG